jgi:hypothetical protein
MDQEPDDVRFGCDTEQLPVVHHLERTNLILLPDHLRWTASFFLSSKTVGSNQFLPS